MGQPENQVKHPDRIRSSLSENPSDSRYRGLEILHGAGKGNPNVAGCPERGAWNRDNIGIADQQFRQCGIRFKPFSLQRFFDPWEGIKGAFTATALASRGSSYAPSAGDEKPDHWKATPATKPAACSALLADPSKNLVS